MNCEMVDCRLEGFSCGFSFDFLGGPGAQHGAMRHAAATPKLSAQLNAVPTESSLLWHLNRTLLLLLLCAGTLLLSQHLQPLPIESHTAAAAVAGPVVAAAAVR